MHSDGANVTLLRERRQGMDRVSAAVSTRGGKTAGGTDGFTLVEMLVILAIMGIAVTMAARSMGGGADRRALHVADAIAAEIGRLRADALRSGRSGRLVFEPPTGRFLSSRAGMAPIGAAALRVSVEADGPDRAVPGEIRFLPDGSSTGGRIVLDTGAARLVVTVSALTGRVRRDGVR